MKGVGIGVKAGLSLSTRPNTPHDWKTMYRVCWYAHTNYKPKSRNYFSVRYKSDVPLTMDDLMCPKCGRDSKPAPAWVRGEVARGIQLGLRLGHTLKFGKPRG